MMLLYKAPVAAVQCRDAVRAAPKLLQHGRRCLNVKAFKDDKEQAKESTETAVTNVPQQQGGASDVQRRDRHHPLRRMNDMVREMDSLMNSFFGPSFGPSALLPRSAFDLLDAPSALMASMPELPAMNRMALHVDQDDQAYYVQAEVPGFSKEDVKIHLNPDNTLSISAESKAQEEEKDKGGKVTRFSRRQSSFFRSVLLPDNVNAEGIAATTKDGMLTVTIPKKEIPEVKPKQIPVH